MRLFSNRTCNQLPEYAAASWPDNARGNARPVYPVSGSGVILTGSVQPIRITRLEQDGQVIVRTGFNVFLQSDPSALNGGLGIQEGDAFRYAGRMVIAQGPAEPPGETGATWKVECLDVE